MSQSKTKTEIDVLMESSRISFFTKDQVKELIRSLSKYATCFKILQFIETMDFYCGEYVRGGKNLSADQRRKRRDEVKYQLIQPILAIIARLKRLRTGTDIVCYPETLERLAFMDDAYDGKGELKGETWVNRSIQKKSLDAIKPLVELVTSIEAANDIFNAPMRKGRPGTDPTGLVALVIRFYDHFIDDPTTYPDGGAYIAVKWALEALNITHREYPDRAIKKAIAELKNSPYKIKNRVDKNP